MVTATREYACSEPNELTGFPPSKEKCLEWLEKIKANGVKEGDEVLLIGGINAGKIVEFTYDLEKLSFTDCGISLKEFVGGWFYLESEDKACKPLYYDFTDEDEDSFLEQKNILVVSTTALGAKISTVLSVCGKGQNGMSFEMDMEMPEELTAVLDHESTTDRFLAFDTAKDMYTYLAYLEDGQ